MLKKVGVSARMAEPDDEAGDPSQDAALASYSQVSDKESNSLLNRIDGAFAFLTDGFMEEAESVDSSEKITVNASALNLNKPQENTINHDTGRKTPKSSAKLDSANEESVRGGPTTLHDTYFSKYNNYSNRVIPRLPVEAAQPKQDKSKTLSPSKTPLNSQHFPIRSTPRRATTTRKKL